MVEGAKLLCREERYGMNIQLNVYQRMEKCEYIIVEVTVV
jgi:hypothetical protein